MPRRKSSLKKSRADKKRHLRNLRVKQRLKNTLKKFQELVSDKNKEQAQGLLAKIFSQLDKAAKKDIIKRNTVNRKKSRLSQRLAKAT